MEESKRKFFLNIVDMSEKSCAECTMGKEEWIGLTRHTSLVNSTETRSEDRGNTFRKVGSIIKDM